MNDKEKTIINKLKALIENTPYAGEKSTAINVLKNYCLKHNISDSELEDSEKKYFEYFVTGCRDGKHFDENIELFEVVCQKFYERRNESFWEQEHKGLQFKKQFRYLLYMTSTDFINLIAEYEFYKSAFKRSYKKAFAQWQKDFFRAFLKKQNLLLKPTEENFFESPTASEIRREERVDLIASEIEKKHFHKQIK